MARKNDDNHLLFENEELKRCLNEKEEQLVHLSNEKNEIKVHVNELTKSLELLKLKNKQVERELIDEKNPNKLLKMIKAIKKRSK